MQGDRQLIDVFAFTRAVNLGMTGQNLLDQGGAGTDHAHDEDRRRTIDAEPPCLFEELRSENAHQIGDQKAEPFAIECLVVLAVDLHFEFVGPAVAREGLVIIAEPFPVSCQREVEQAGIRGGLLACFKEFLNALDVGVRQGVFTVRGQISEDAKRLCRVGIEPLRFQGDGKRLIHLPHLLQGFTEQNAVKDGTGFQANGGAEMRDGLGNAAGGVQSGRQIAVEIRLVRQLGDGLADHLNGEFRPAQLIGHHAQQV